MRWLIKRERLWQSVSFYDKANYNQKGYFFFIIGKIYSILEKYEAAHQNWQIISN